MSIFHGLRRSAAAILLLLYPALSAIAADQSFEQWRATDRHRAFVLDKARQNLAEQLRICPTAKIELSHAVVDTKKPIVMGEDGSPTSGRWTEFVTLSGCGTDETLRVSSFDAFPGGWLRYVQRVPASITVEGDDQRNIVPRD